MENLQSHPVDFEGAPPELLDSEGKVQRVVQIGDILEVPDEVGALTKVVVEELCSMAQKLCLIVYDPLTEKRWLVDMPMTESERKAAARFSDAVFGKPTAARKLSEDDPFDFYDSMLAVYGKTPADKLKNLMSDDPHLRQWASLPPAQARKRLAREYTKSMWARMKKDQCAEGAPQ